MAFEWFSSYLTGRQQCVAIDVFSSDSLTPATGEPQGSILGDSSYFLIYMNNIPNAGECLMCMYIIRRWHPI